MPRCIEPRARIVPKLDWVCRYCAMNSRGKGSGIDRCSARLTFRIADIRLKSSTLRAICTQAQMPRDEFLRAYYRS
jgi:hypothetical protein